LKQAKTTLAAAMAGTLVLGSVVLAQDKEAQVEIELMT
jgi:hypothetical protein